MAILEHRRLGEKHNADNDYRLTDQRVFGDSPHVLRVFQQSRERPSGHELHSYSSDPTDTTAANMPTPGFKNKQNGTGLTCHNTR